MRELILKITTLAAKWHTANVCMIHWNKNEKQTDGNRIAGSHQLKAAARSVISVLRDPKTGLRTLKRDRNLGEEQPGINFRIEAPDGQVVWTDSVPIPENMGSKVATAEKWLTDTLYGAEGGMKVSDCIALAHAAGISRSSIYQARANLNLTVGLISRYTGYKEESFWELASDKNKWLLPTLHTHAPGEPTPQYGS